MTTNDISFLCDYIGCYNKVHVPKFIKIDNVFRTMLLVCPEHSSKLENGPYEIVVEGDDIIR